ncbi:hypothetical protein, partial [Mesorhizobium sp. M0898]|uniref:hypothetical protein n=1 Tax=Mesorhizobium sp. M0898 TaxID=2957020 RepID=UPI003337EB05
LLLATIRQQLLPQVLGQDLHVGLLLVGLAGAEWLLLRIDSQYVQRHLINRLKSKKISPLQNSNTFLPKNPLVTTRNTFEPALDYFFGNCFLCMLT